MIPRPVFVGLVGMLFVLVGLFHILTSKDTIVACQRDAQNITCEVTEMFVFSERTKKVVPKEVSMTGNKDLWGRGFKLFLNTSDGRYQISGPSKSSAEDRRLSERQSQLDYFFRRNRGGNSVSISYLNRERGLVQGALFVLVGLLIGAVGMKLFLRKDNTGMDIASVWDAWIRSGKVTGRGWWGP